MNDSKKESRKRSDVSKEVIDIFIRNNLTLAEVENVMNEINRQTKYLLRFHSQ